MNLQHSTTGTAGTKRTRRFYDGEGWMEHDGETTDHVLFGVKEDGPIRIKLHEVHVERVRSALSRAGTGLNLLECGCGGNPERQLFDLCSHYSGVDFSEQGISLATEKLKQVDLESDLRTADACNLPFDDGAFDAVYSAHMIYHIEDPAAQAAALTQLLRVTRSGGVVVVIAANPYPLLFPLRFIRRVIADAPGVGLLANKLRKTPPLPYRPMPIGWMRNCLAGGGKVEVLTCGLPSTHFNQSVSEFSSVGRQLWKAIRWLDLNVPALSSYLGNYVLYSVRKP